jgi:hypothetical protein
VFQRLVLECTLITSRLYISPNTLLLKRVNSMWISVKVRVRKWKFECSVSSLFWFRRMKVLCTLNVLSLVLRSWPYGIVLQLKSLLSKIPTRKKIPANWSKKGEFVHVVWTFFYNFLWYIRRAIESSNNFRHVHENIAMLTTSNFNQSDRFAKFSFMGKRNY